MSTKTKSGQANIHSHLVLGPQIKALAAERDKYRRCLETLQARLEMYTSHEKLSDPQTEVHVMYKLIQNALKVRK